MNEIQDKHITEFTSQFDKLVSEQKLNMNSLEELMSNNIEDYKNDLRNQTEKILLSHIDEKEIIFKKNRNGRKKDIH